MLKGVSANVYFLRDRLVDRATPGEKLPSFEIAEGNPLDAAWRTSRGISVQDLRETRLLGLWRLGGWQLLGGLLALAEISPGRLELYGKLALRIEPYFALPHREAPQQRWSYEFFLVRRDGSTGSAEVVRRWLFEAPQVILGRFPDRPVRAELKYDPTSRRARFLVHGLASPFQEEFEVTGGRR